MVTSFLRMQAAPSDVVFEPLINLLNDPIAELDQFPQAFDALFSGLLKQGEILVFPCGKLANWLVPESAEGQIADLSEMEACNDLQLWDEKENCWRYRKILAFAKVDYDYCLVQVNLEAGSLALSVFSTAYDLSRFWDFNNDAAMDTETSIHYHNFSASLAAWLGMLSNGHFQASGHAELHYHHTRFPMLDLIKHILISAVLFPDLPYAEISDPVDLAERLSAVARVQAELVALEQEHEEDLADYADEPVPVHCYKNFNESTDSLLLIRATPLNLTNDCHIAAETNELRGVTRTMKKLTRKFIKQFPAKTSMPLAVLYFCPQPMTHAEIVAAAIELGFELGVDSKAPVAVQRKQKKKVEQSIQATFFANGQPRLHNEEGKQIYAEPEPGREFFLTERLPLRNSRGNNTHVTTRTLTEFGRQRVREMLRLVPFTFRSSHAGPKNLLELICKTLLKHGRMTAKQVVALWKQELGFECVSFTVISMFKNAQKLGLVSVAAGGKNPTYRLKRRRVHVIEDGPAPDYVPNIRPPEDVILEGADSVVLVPAYVEEIGSCLRASFEKERVLSISECLLVLVTGDYTMDQLREVLDSMVQQKLLYKLANPKSNAHDLYMCRLDGQGDQLEFEYFYSLIKHFNLTEQQRENFALHRAQVHSAFLSGDVITNSAMRSLLELTTDFNNPTESSAVVVLENVGPLAFLGNGLFANVDLPQGLLIPVTGRQELDSETPDVFLPYGFKFRSLLPGRLTYAVDTCPDGVVTCWAGFINDPRNTNSTANAVPVCSGFEDRMYLKLTTAVPAGQQIFWEYGDEYWQEVSALQQEQSRQIFKDIDMSVFDFGDKNNMNARMSVFDFGSNSDAQNIIGESAEFALPYPEPFLSF